MTGVSECSQQRGNLKDDGYKRNTTWKQHELMEHVCLYVDMLLSNTA
ncbi:hypothetical protein [Photorhabdus africana]|nr:hypothetical protein [Photorhabdus sp. CRI-LC]